MSNESELMIDYLRQVVQQLHKNVGISHDDYVKFGQYYENLLEVNKSMNLTRIVEPMEVAAKHFGDALTVYDERIFPKGCRVIDVGTGAGFPGVPLAIILKESRFTLLDSLQKRTRFIESAVNNIQLHNIEVVQSRAEDLARNPQYREKFDVVLARAVASLNVLSELCLPFLKPGGVFLAMKGPKAMDEIESARNAIKVLGGGTVSIESRKLPFVEEDRIIICIEKVRHTPMLFPRKAGIPERDPLK